jgi:hypothetical protein
VIVLNWVIRGVAPLLVPFLTQAILVLGVETFWPSAWTWMNALSATSTILAMAVILGPSLVVGVFLLVRAFGRSAMPIGIIYVPFMTVVLSFMDRPFGAQSLTGC